MASIGNDPGGRRRILFLAPDGKRMTVRLGKCDLKTAEAICQHIEALLAAQLGGQPVPRDTAAWLGTVGPQLRDKLARVGLIEARSDAQGDPTLGKFLAEYLAQRPDLGPGTQVVLSLIHI